MALFAPHTYFESLDPPKMHHVCTLALEKLDFAGAFASRGLTGATRLERELATENVPERCNDVLAELRQLDLNVAGAPVRFGRTLVQGEDRNGQHGAETCGDSVQSASRWAASGRGFPLTAGLERGRSAGAFRENVGAGEDRNGQHGAETCGDSVQSASRWAASGRGFPFAELLAISCFANCNGGGQQKFWWSVVGGTGGIV